MPAIHSSIIEVGSAAIDRNGHVNNLKYLEWMQEAAIRHSAVQSWTEERYFETGASWVVRSHFIEYLRPALAGEILTLHTWVRAIGRTSSPRGYLFWRDADHSIVAKAETLWVFVDHVTGRTRPIPDALRNAFALVETDDEVAATLGLPIRKRDDAG
jgi:acyl-CoA thioester hydrolase